LLKFLVFNLSVSAAD